VAHLFLGLGLVGALCVLIYISAVQSHRWQRGSGMTSIFVCLVLCSTVLHPLANTYHLGYLLAGIVVLFVSVFTGVTVAHTFIRR
jgi:hypothetical protein